MHHFTTLPNKTTTVHTIIIKEHKNLPPKKWQKQVTEKTFQEMYINVGMANRENDPNKNGMTYASHTLPSLCVKCMSSRSCLGHFSRFAIPTLMYISFFSVTCTHYTAVLLVSQIQYDTDRNCRAIDYTKLGAHPCPYHSRKLDQHLCPYLRGSILAYVPSRHWMLHK